MAAPGGVLALPAPAPPPPVVVTVGAPLAARCLAFIPTNDPIVQRTRFLPWTDHAAVGGAAAMSSIPAYVLLRHFIVRCTIGGLPADLAAAQLRSVLTGSLTGAAWGRILTEFVASGLLNLQFTKRRELLVAVKAVQINNPGNLALLAADIAPPSCSSLLVTSDLFSWAESFCSGGASEGFCPAKSLSWAVFDR